MNEVSENANARVSKVPKVPSTLSLSLLSRMYVELQVQSACLVCTCFQALVILVPSATRLKMSPTTWPKETEALGDENELSFSGLSVCFLGFSWILQCKASVVQHKHFVTRFEVNCHKKSLKFLRRVLESPWKVLEFFAWKSVRTCYVAGADLGGGCRGCAPPPETKLSSSYIGIRF